jgi:hypothetical protein
MNATTISECRALAHQFYEQNTDRIYGLCMYMDLLEGASGPSIRAYAITVAELLDKYASHQLCATPCFNQLRLEIRDTFNY